MKKYFNSKILLLIIVLAAAFLRMNNLNNNPPALNWDEAAWGYNSYSLGIDGKDEFGKFLPIQYLESYGDYKPPVYGYLGVIPVKLFGLNAFSVRFPSAALGVLTVFLTYFLVKELFYKRRDEKIELVALASTLFLAISPWHIMLSRGAYEANVSTFFIGLGIFTFLRAINKNMWFLSISAVSFGLSLYTFNTARVFVPLLIVFMAFVFHKNLLSDMKRVLLSAIIGLILIAPLIPFLFSPQAKLRFAEVNIFSDINVVKMSNQEIANDNGAFWSKIIHNRRILFAQDFLKHYGDNLNPSFLFINGDGNPRFSTQDVGQMFILDLPFLVLGIFVLFKRKEGFYWVLPIWFLLGIIPAATARETPHGLRIETVIPTLQILAAVGFVEFVYFFKKYRKAVGIGLSILLFLNFYYFYHGYINHYAREYSSEWQYPYKDAVSYVSSVKNNYQSIEITQELGRPYIYFLLYTKYDPKQFRSSAKIDREALGFVHVRSFDKYKFKESIIGDKLDSKTLYLDVPKNIPNNVKILKTFYLLDGTPSLMAYETNK